MTDNGIIKKSLFFLQVEGFSEKKAALRNDVNL